MNALPKIKDWTPQSWQSRKALQQPTYSDVAKLERVVAEAPRAAEAWAALSFALIRSGQAAPAKDAARSALSVEAEAAASNPNGLVVGLHTETTAAGVACAGSS